MVSHWLGDQDRGLRQELLDFVKCLLGLGRLFKAAGLLQKLIEGESSFSRHEIKWLSTVRHPITRCTPFYILDQTHTRDGRDLLWVGFDAVLGDNKTQQHTPWVPENALLEVEFDTICSEFHEGLP